MLKQIVFIPLLLLCAVVAFGQGACVPGIVLLDTGRPANGATVRVCSAGSTGSPCTPTISLFSDPSLSVGVTNPLTTDARGNYKACLAAGANYDFEYAGTGLSTFKVTNVTVGASAPITATTLASASANPATVGVIKLASGDGIDWRNAANSGNDQLVKSGAASGNLPADYLDATAFGGARAAAFIDNSANPAASGVVRCGNNVTCIAARNAANSGDLILWLLDGSNNAQVNPPIRQVEQAAPSGIASSDLLWADSTAHRWKQLSNNGTAKTIANTDGDTFTTTTLTSPTINTPSISDPTITGNTLVKRIKATQGTSLVTGDFSISGWGSTATVSSVSGTDSAFSVTVSSSGTGQSANPQTTLTFHDGTWTNSPICVIGRVDGNSSTGGNGITAATASSATALQMTFISTPIAGTAYTVNVICMGR